MTDETTTETTTTTTEVKDGGFQPITSQADLDKILGARLARDREKTAAEIEALRDKAAKYDEAVEAAQTEQEKAVKAAREEGKTEALSAANSRLVTAEARALAAEAKFRNPTLAVRAIDLRDVKVNDDGTVDADAIKARLKELSDADPYLIDDGAKPRPKPDAGQGRGTGEVKPSVNAGREMFQARKGGTTTKTA